MKNPHTYRNYALEPQQAAKWIVDQASHASQHTSNAFDYHGATRESGDFHLNKVREHVANIRELCNILEELLTKAESDQ
jgi:hypothetical protein